VTACVAVIYGFTTLNAANFAAWESSDKEAFHAFDATVLRSVAVEAVRIWTSLAGTSDKVIVVAVFASIAAASRWRTLPAVIIQATHFQAFAQSALVAFLAQLAFFAI